MTQTLHEQSQETLFCTCFAVIDNTHAAFHSDGLIAEMFEV